MVLLRLRQDHIRRDCRICQESLISWPARRIPTAGHRVRRRFERVLKSSIIAFTVAAERRAKRILQMLDRVANRRMDRCFTIRP